MRFCCFSGMINTVRSVNRLKQEPIIQYQMTASLTLLTDKNPLTIEAVWTACNQNLTWHRACEGSLNARPSLNFQ